jgi:hypothetical protein
MSEPDLSIQQQKAAVLQQMGQIPYLIRGKLSSQTYVAKGRSQGPYFTLQRWEEGKNKSQRIPPQQLPMIQEAVTGFEHFQQLADQFVGLTEQQTWEALPADLKKKFRQFSQPPFPTPAPSSKKRAGS